MPTHQDFTGTSDSEMLRRVVASHPGRFNGEFWRVFDGFIAPCVPSNGTIVDLGCGPGLFLRDISMRFPHVALSGFDVTGAMIDYARELTYEREAPEFLQLDLTHESIPISDGSVNLVTMTAVMHLFDDPLSIFAEIRRILSRTHGIFLLYDWVRTSIGSYLDSRNLSDSETRNTNDKNMFRLFPHHNRYTARDWRWLLNRGGFRVRTMVRPREHFILFIAGPS